MELVAAACVVDIGRFEMDEKPSGTNGIYEVLQGRDRTTRRRVTIRRATYNHRAKGRHTIQELGDLLNGFFREVANLRYAVHPAFPSLVGWNIEITPAAALFYIVTEYCLCSPLKRLDPPGGGYDISPTTLQILLFGVAHGLHHLHKANMVHQDIKPSNIWLDENRYPVLVNCGIPSWKVSRPERMVIRGSGEYLPRTILDHKYDFGIEAFSYGMILYEVTENKEIGNRGPGEFPVVPETNRYKELLEYCRRQAWNVNNNQDVMEQALDFMQKPENLVPHADPVAFWLYLGWLEYSKFLFSRAPKSTGFVFRVCQNRRQLEGIVSRCHDLAKIVSDLVSWFDNPVSCVDDGRSAHYQRVLNSKSSFDPASMFLPGEEPPCVSLLTTAVQTLDAGWTITELRRDPTGAIYSRCTLREDGAQGEKELQMKTTEISQDDPDAVNSVIHFFRELITQFYIQHPAFYRVVGWNVFAEGDKYKLCLFGDVVLDTAQDSVLEIDNVQDGGDVDATGKTIILYGIARAMAELHSLNIVHRDLKLVSVDLDSMKYPRLSNFWYAKGEDENPCSKSAYPSVSIYQAPEIMQHQKFTFEADVYAFGILCSGVMEARFPVIDGATTTRAIIREVTNGNRPQLSKAKPSHQELVKKLWDGNPSARLPFVELVKKFEDPNYWFDGTDPSRFYQYKGYLDAFDQFRAPQEFIPSQWITRVSRLRKLIPDLDAFRNDIVGLLASVLSRVTIDEVPSRQSTELGDLIRESFRTSHHIDPKKFSQYAKKYMSNVVPVAIKQNARALTPLTGAIFDYKGLTFDPTFPERHGAFGVVRKATYPGVSSALAVKLVTPSCHNGRRVDEDVASQYLCGTFREILSGIYCQHPAVVKNYGWNYVWSRNANPSEMVIVTEFAERGSLLDRIRSKSMTPTEKMVSLYGMARGLRHMHSLELLHRDFKPENVVIDGHNRPLVCDLGLSRLVLDGEATRKQGTDTYMAPEVLMAEDLENDRPWLFPADVYAYAITFWEVIAQSKYVVKNADVEKVRNWANPLRPPLDRIESDLHRELLERMWACDQDVRPDFGEIVEKLEQKAYWLPGTDEKEFLDYIGYLNAEETKIKKEEQPLWKGMLLGAGMAFEFARKLNVSREILNDLDLGTGLTPRVVVAMGMLCGGDDAIQQKVKKAARESLRKHGMLDPAMMNEQAEANPFDDM